MNVAGYRTTGEFTTTGGGRCEWTFAEKGGRTYFLKRFLQPKPVMPGQLGGPKTLERQRKRCEAFEARQNKVLLALKGKTGTGGNLIAPIAFFQADGCYFKVTEKIDTRGVTTDKVAGLPVESQAIILRSAANSVRILHSSGIVHGDIKTDNVLIRSRDGGLMTASLIDFDDSYFAGAPPMPPEEFVFDPPYASPEAFAFVHEANAESAARLGCAADVFSLAIVFIEYLSGEKPFAAHGDHAYCGEAALAGVPLEMRLPAAWESAKPLLSSMLSADASKRPTVSEVLANLKYLPGEAPKPVERTPAPPPPPPAKPALRINMRAKADAPAAAPEPTPAPTASKLRGKLSRPERE